MSSILGECEVWEFKGKPTDVLNISEKPQRTFTGTRKNEDMINISDILKREWSVKRELKELTNILEKIQFLFQPRPLTDQIKIIDTLIRTLMGTRTMEEKTNILDTISLLLKPRIREIVNIRDTVSRLFVGERQTYDITNLTDIARLLFRPTPIIEQINITETSRILFYPSPLVDQINIIDSISYIFNQRRFPIDIIEVNDILQRTFYGTRTMVDLVDVMDYIVKIVYGVPRVEFDAIVESGIYDFNDIFTVHVYVEDIDLEEPINDADCFVDIYYPNGTQFKNDAVMSFITDGIYVYQNETETITGTYNIFARCKYKTVYAYDSTIMQVYDKASESNVTDIYDFWACDKTSNTVCAFLSAINGTVSTNEVNLEDILDYWDCIGDPEICNKLDDIVNNVLSVKNQTTTILNETESIEEAVEETKEKLSMFPDIQGKKWLSLFIFVAVLFMILIFAFKKEYQRYFHDRITERIELDRQTVGFLFSIIIGGVVAYTSHLFNSFLINSIAIPVLILATIIFLNLTDIEGAILGLSVALFQNGFNIWIWGGYTGVITSKFIITIITYTFIGYLLGKNAEEKIRRLVGVAGAIIIMLLYSAVLFVL